VLVAGMLWQDVQVMAVALTQLSDAVPLPPVKFPWQ
jgi:hypothetical protein